MPLLINGFDNKIDFGCNLISDIGKTFHLRYILTDAELLEKYLLDKYIFFIDCADGAFLIISNKTISKIGGLDNKMFMYFEDVDYSLRGWKNKIPSLLLPVVIGKHYRSSSTEKNKENIIYFEFLNNFLIVKRYFGIISLFKLIVWYLFLPFRTMYSNPTIVKNKYYIVLDQINLPKIVILKIFTLSLLNVFYKNNDKWGRILLPSVKISFKMMLASSELIKVVRGKYKYWLHNRLCYVG
jgi:GT2 family glycosyltransferase